MSEKKQELHPKKNPPLTTAVATMITTTMTIIIIMKTTITTMVWLGWPSLQNHHGYHDQDDHPPSFDWLIRGRANLVLWHYVHYWTIMLSLISITEPLCFPLYPLLNHYAFPYIHYWTIMLSLISTTEPLFFLLRSLQNHYAFPYIHYKTITLSQHYSNFRPVLTMEHTTFFLGTSW
jgi:hypothetical protein